jgi:hypothetical protein
MEMTGSPRCWTALAVSWMYRNCALRSGWEQPFPVIKLERVRVHQCKAVESKKLTVSAGPVAREQVQPGEAVQSRKLLKVAEPLTAVVPQAS